MELYKGLKYRKLFVVRSNKWNARRVISDEKRYRVNSGVVLLFYQAIYVKKDKR